MVRQSFEGTWEEVAQHAGELAGHRVRLTVLEDAPNGSSRAPDGKAAPKQTLDQLMKDYIGCVSSGKPSNLAEHVDEAFGEIMEEKRRKWKKRK